MAMTPAKTPGPMIAIRRSAQISELIERDETITSRATGRMNSTDGVVFRAAMKATGTARQIAMSVPSVAMFSVSQIGRPSWVMYVQRGGVGARPDIARDARCVPHEEPGGRLGNPLPANNKDRDADQPAEPAEEVLAGRPPSPGLRTALLENRHYCTFALMMPERYSSDMTIPMIRIRIAAAVSYS